MNRDEIDYLFTTEGHLIPLRSKQLLDNAALHQPLDEPPAASIARRRKRSSPKFTSAPAAATTAGRSPKRATFRKSASASPRESASRSRMSLFGERPLRAALRNVTTHPNSHYLFTVGSIFELIPFLLNDIKRNLLNLID